LQDRLDGRAGNRRLPGGWLQLLRYRIVILTGEELLSRRVLQRDPDAVSRHLAGDAVILPVRHKVADLTAIYTLNDTGSFIWELIDGVRTLGDLVNELVAHFEVEPDEARQGVLALVEDLEAEGLVRETQA
jgi:hypothetical protein